MLRDFFLLFFPANSAITSLKSKVSNNFDSIVNLAILLKRLWTIVDRCMFLTLLRVENDLSASQFVMGIVRNKRYAI